MKSQAVFTNYRCNQNCTYCTLRRPSDVPAHIRPQAVRARIDEAIAGGASEIAISGGEPTMRADLASLVAFAKERGSSVTLETNATLLGPAEASALAAAGLAAARVNLSGWGPALDEVTRDPGGFDRTMAGLRALAAAGIPIEIRAAVVRSTLALLPGLPERLAEALGARAVRLVSPVVPIAAPADDELVSFEEAASAIAALESSGRRAGIPVRMPPEHVVPPCAFPEGSRVANLFSLTRGGGSREGYVKLEACSGCKVVDRCPGMPTAYLDRRSAPTMRPIVEDRVRRRLSVISTIEAQVDREFIQPNRFYAEGYGQVDEELVRVVFHCNQACHFCFVSTHLPAVDDARVEAAIASAAARGVKITLSGGEPTLHPRLVEFVRLAKRDSALPVQLQTNAIRLADAELTRALEAAGLDEAFVSLHAATAEVSDALTAAPGTFERTLLGIDALAATRIRLILNFVISATNHAELPAFARMVAARWPRAIVNISFVAPSADVVPRDKALIPRYSDAMPSLTAALSEADRLGIDVGGFASMCGIPLCLVPRDVRHESLLTIEAGYDRGEFIKASECARCSLEARCWGVRRGYAELYGTDELRSIPAGVA